VNVSEISCDVSPALDAPGSVAPRRNCARHFLRRRALPQTPTTWRSIAFTTETLGEQIALRTVWSSPGLQRCL